MMEEVFKKLGVAHHYYDCARKMILRMFDDGALPKVEPKIEQGTQEFTSNRKWKAFLDFHLFRQMLTDRRLLEGYLMGSEIGMKYDSRSQGKKEYLTVEFYIKD